LVNDKLDRIWKEAVEAYSGQCPGIYLKRLREEKQKLPVEIAGVLT
jgi:hypothetical protein